MSLRLVWYSLFLFLAAAGCAYNPDLAGTRLDCSGNGTCPEGFVCPEKGEKICRPGGRQPDGTGEDAGGGDGDLAGTDDASRPDTSDAGARDAWTPDSGGCRDGESLPCYEGAPETRNNGLCEDGLKECIHGVFGTCGGQVLPAAEACDNLDNNCDGATDGITRQCSNECGEGIETCSTGTWAGCTAPVNCPGRQWAVSGRNWLKDGRAVSLTGVYDDNVIQHHGNASGVSIETYLAALRMKDLNYTRICLDQHLGLWRSTEQPEKYNQDQSQPLWPFRKVALGDAVAHAWDLTSKNDGYFDLLKRYLETAEEMGMMVELTLFDENAVDVHWNFSPWNPANNVNLFEEEVSDWPDLYGNPSSKPVLAGVMRVYIDNVLDETGGFGNVMYEIVNAPGGQDSAFAEYWISYIDSKTTAPISYHHHGGFNPGLDARVDQINYHMSDDPDADRCHRMALEYSSYGKAVSLDEHWLGNAGFGDMKDMRRRIWAAWTAGAGSAYLDWTFFPDNEFPEAALDYVNILLSLSSELRNLGEIEPDDDVVASKPEAAYAYTRANQAGKTYVSYFWADQEWSGEVKVVLADGRYAGGWLDPMTGANMGQLLSFDHSGGEKRLTVPGTSTEYDVVLVLSDVAQGNRMPRVPAKSPGHGFGPRSSVPAK